jgi:CubicO group peptidase (beta-lactamase class C family)
MRTIIRRGGVGAAIAILFASAAGSVPADFKAKADAYLRSAYPADAPGAAVIVVDHGKVVYAGGRGLADVGNRRRIAPNTVFRLGSLTKQFTAAVILQLQQEGRLSLSDPLSKYLPDYPGPGADATIAQLLNHTSGIRNFTEVHSWMLSGRRARPITTARLIEAFKNEPVDFAPGTKWHYDNSGYVLLGAIIEKVTGKPWYVAVQERLTEPLRLRTIRYGVAESSTRHMARGYVTEGGRVVRASPLHLSNAHAAGALLASVEDFAKWAEALHQGRILNRASYVRMIAPTKLPGGSLVPYGFGQGLGTLRGRDAISHGGETAGFENAATYIPQENLFVAVFTNSNDPAVPSAIARAKIAAMALGQPYPEFHKAPVAASDIEPLLGIYAAAAGERRFFAKEGRLFTRLKGGSDQEVFAAGGDRFFYGPTTLDWFEVRREPAGMHAMLMYRGPAQTAEIAVRVGAVPADAALAVRRDILERYVGTYRTEGRTAEVRLAEDGSLTLRVGRQEPRRLSPVSETDFRVEGMDATLAFHSTAGSVIDLTFRQGDHETRAERQPGG